MAAAIALAFSCTKPDDGPAGGNGTLVIDADRFEIVADGKDAAQITVEYDGKTVTDGVSFYDAATNVPVSVKSMRFTTRTVGEHRFYATYSGAKSNTLSINAVGKLASGGVADHIFTFKNNDSEWNLDKCKVLVYVTSSTGNIQIVNNALTVPV